MYRGEYNLSLEYLEKAILLGEETNCNSLPSYYLWVGYVYFLVGEYDLGMERLYDSLESFGKQNNAWGKAFAYSKLGLASDGLGNYQEALNFHYQSLAIFKLTNDHAGQGYDLSRMSLGALLLGDFQIALQYGQDGLEQFEEVGHRWGICASLCRIGYAKLGLGEIEEAGSILWDALKRSYQNQFFPLCLHALGGIAIQKLLVGSKSEAVELSRYVLGHPKTPEIYKELTWKWFDRKTTSASGNDGEQPALDMMVREILEEQSRNSQS
jgi:tetratricopeptide (TPR) repeat protein